MQVQDILAKDLVGDEWLTEDELRFLMSVTDEEQLQLIYKKAYEVKAKYVKPVAYYRGPVSYTHLVLIMARQRKRKFLMIT